MGKTGEGEKQGKSGRLNKTGVAKKARRAVAHQHGAAGKRGGPLVTRKSVKAASKVMSEAEHRREREREEHMRHKEAERERLDALSNADRKRELKRKRKAQSEVTFDERSLKSFVGGMRRRKQERQAKAITELRDQEKEQRREERRFKRERLESMKRESELHLAVLRGEKTMDEVKRQREAAGDIDPTTVRQRRAQAAPSVLSFPTVRHDEQVRRDEKRALEEDQQAKRRDLVRMAGHIAQKERDEEEEEEEEDESSSSSSSYSSSDDSSSSSGSHDESSSDSDDSDDSDDSSSSESSSDDSSPRRVQAQRGRQRVVATIERM